MGVVGLQGEGKVKKVFIFKAVLEGQGLKKSLRNPAHPGGQCRPTLVVAETRSSHIPVGNVAWRREPTYASKNHVEPQAARCRQDRFVPTYTRTHADGWTHQEHGDPTINMDTYAHGAR